MCACQHAVGVRVSSNLRRSESRVEPPHIERHTFQRGERGERGDSRCSVGLPRVRVFTTQGREGVRESESWIMCLYMRSMAVVLKATILVILNYVCVSGKARMCLS